MEDEGLRQLPKLD